MTDAVPQPADAPSTSDIGGVAIRGYRAPSFLETPGAKDVGIEIFSPSKGWNMTGWRSGLVAGNAEVVERYRAGKVKAVVKGNAAESTIGYLAVWRLEQGEWKFLAWQSCKIPPAAAAK